MCVRGTVCVCAWVGVFLSVCVFQSMPIFLPPWFGKHTPTDCIKLNDIDCDNSNNSIFSSSSSSSWFAGNLHYVTEIKYERK